MFARPLPSHRPLGSTGASLAAGAFAVLSGAVAGALPPLYGAVLFAGLVVAFAAFVSPVLGLAVLAVAIPFSPAEGSGRLPVAPSDALVALILVAAALAFLSRRVRILRLTVAFWPGMAFIAVLLLSASFAPDRIASAKEILRWVALLGTLVVAASFCGRAPARRIVLSALFAALTGEAVLGWAQFFLRRGPPAFRIGPFLRAYGTFGQPNPYGGYLAMLLPVAIAVVIAERPWARRPSTLGALAAVGAATGGAALLMSLSRGALVGLLVGLALLFVLNVRRGGLVVLALALGIAVAFGLQTLNLVPGVVAARLAQIIQYVGWFDASTVQPTPQNWAIVERMAHWQAAWNMYLAHPLLGVGPGHYPLAYPDFRVNDLWKAPLGHAHNIYLNVMAEEGFFGIIAYAAFWLGWVVVLFGAYRRSGAPADRALASGVTAGLLAVTIHNLFDNLMVHGLGTQMGLLIGLAAAILPASGRRETGDAGTHG